jgi:hypothetical protein
MVRSAEETAAQIEQAKREVQFDRSEFEKTVPNDSKFAPDTFLRRQSVCPTTLPAEDAAHAANVAADSDDDDDIERVHTLAVFEELIKDHLDRDRFEATRGEMNKDFHDKMGALAEYYGKRSTNGPGIPFRAFLEASKTLLPFEGVLDEKNFTSLTDAAPADMFREMKLRTLMMLAYRQQVKELTLIGHRLDHAQMCLIGWVRYFANKFEAQKNASPSSAQPRASEDQIEDLIDQVAERDAEIALLKDTVAGMATRMVNAPTKKPHSRNVERPFTSSPATNRSDRARPPSTTAETGNARSKSSKVDSAPVFHNEEKRDTVTFEVWYRQICNKLKVNSDHFSNDYAKCVHIESRLGGEAARDLQPYLDDTHPDALTDSEALLDHLWNEYHDHNAQETSNSAFQKLAMSPGDDYTAFKNKFVRLAGECRFPRDQWKAEFKRKLTPLMKNYMTSAYIDPKYDFEGYARYGAEIALNFAQAQRDRKDKEPVKAKDSNDRGKRGSRGTGQSRSDYQKPAAKLSSSQKGTLPARPSPAEIKKLMAEGKCFICREHGHTTRNCPRKDEAAAAEDARIQSVVDKYADKESKKKTKAKATRKVAVQESNKTQLDESSELSSDISSDSSSTN